MLFNKLTCHLVFAVLLVAGLTFVATPGTADVKPVLSVPDEVENVDDEPDTQGVEVYGIRAENVTFELTITFREDLNAVSPVTGFDAEDIQLVAADSNDGIVPGGQQFLLFDPMPMAAYTQPQSPPRECQYGHYKRAKRGCQYSW